MQSEVLSRTRQTPLSGRVTWKGTRQISTEHAQMEVASRGNHRVLVFRGRGCESLRGIIHLLDGALQLFPHLRELWIPLFTGRKRSLHALQSEGKLGVLLPDPCNFLLDPVVFPAADFSPNAR